MMVVTNNGRNMIKAVRVAAFADTAESDNDEHTNGDERDESENDDTNDSDELVELNEAITLHRFPCLAHTSASA